jgi:hypothetical protein
MNAFHCDAEGCDYWESTDVEIPVFYVLTAPDESEMHLCSLDCLTSWSARRSPSKTSKLHAIGLPSSMGPMT